MSMKMRLNSSLNENETAKLNPTAMEAQHLEMESTMRLSGSGSGGSGSGGVSDHDDLTGRSKPNQHPISAIIGLQDELDELHGEIEVKGMSAYEIAVAAGFEGTEEEWLASLQGESGEKGEDACVLLLDSSRGNMFKNNTVSTIIRATVYSGSNVISNLADLIRVLGPTAHLEWYWQRLGEDNFHVISASDSRISNDGFSFALSPDDVDVKVTFQCQVVV